MNRTPAQPTEGMPSLTVGQGRPSTRVLDVYRRVRRRGLAVAMVVAVLGGGAVVLARQGGDAQQTTPSPAGLSVAPAIQPLPASEGAYDPSLPRLLRISRDHPDLFLSAESSEGFREALSREQSELAVAQFCVAVPQNPALFLVSSAEQAERYSEVCTSKRTDSGR